MPAVQVPWPASALPGRWPGEGAGDLLNVFASQVGNEMRWRRPGGLDHVYVDTGETVPRGLHATTDYLISVWEGNLYTRDASGLVGSAATLTGTDRVTIASNLISPTPQVVVVSGTAGAKILDPSTNTLVNYTDADLGTVSTVEYYAGYFFFTRTSGEIVASGLQTTAIDPLSVARAEYSQDKLLRLKNNGTTLLAFGEKTIEVWTDVGTSPFPLARQSAIDVGLLSAWTVAGGPNDWQHGVYFIANDYTVRSLDGQVPRVISNDSVAWDIYQYRASVDDLNCFVYGAGQWSMFCIQSPTWTWEFCVNTGQWHRRRSYLQDRWRGLFSALWRNQWYVQDLGSVYNRPDTGYDTGNILAVNLDTYLEGYDSIPLLIESGPIKDFPASIRIPVVDVDVSVAVGSNIGASFEPTVFLSWSHDGGATWSNPLERSLGAEGDYWRKVTYRMLGRSTHHGVRLRIEMYDPVPFILRSAVSVRTSGSRPRQVGAA